MVPPQHIMWMMNNTTSSTMTMTTGAYYNNFITTVVTPSTTNMLQYYPTQTTGTSASVWHTVAINNTDDIDCPYNNSDELMSSETYAIRHVVDFLNRNCLSISEFASKAFGDKALTLDSGTYRLPGGAILTIEKDRSYHIDDSNHKTTYAANPIRDWNEFINVSDVLDKFMVYIADLNLTKEQFLELPMRLFMLWLVIQAAKKDKEPVPQAEQQQLELALEPLKVRTITREVTLDATGSAKAAYATVAK